MLYVIQVQGLKEESTIREIKERMPLDILTDAFSPNYERQKKVRGEYITERKKCFPGYIFVETNNIKELSKRLYLVPSFTKLLGKQGGEDNFLPLTPEESRMISILYKKDFGYVSSLSNIEVKEGQEIMVIDGPLFGVKSLIKKVNLHRRTVTIQLSIGGHISDVELGINLVS